MTNNAPREDTSEPGREPPEPSADALRRLEERLDRASQAAERLIAEARAEGGSPDGVKPPPAGWQVPNPGSGDGDELALFGQLIQSLRHLLPPDLQRRLTEAVRELLLALRALIDFYLDRLERRAAAPSEMEDIPIS